MKHETIELAKNLARELRKRQTRAEGILWEALRNRRFLGKKFLRQHPLFFEDSAAGPDTKRIRMIGSTISHYKILEKLGEGGMGIVYKVRELPASASQRAVAILRIPTLSVGT